MASSTVKQSMMVVMGFCYTQIALWLVGVRRIEREKEDKGCFRASFFLFFSGIQNTTTTG